MANKSRFLKEGLSIDYTPASLVAAGAIVNLDALAGFASCDIAASEKSALAIEGILRMPFVGGVVANEGDNVWWDADGTPYGGSNDGAATVVASAGDFWIGTLAATTSATGNTCDVMLNRVNPNLPAWPNKTHITTAADLTLVAATHSGGVTHVTPDAQTDTKITLPTGVVGMEYIIQYDGADGGNLTQVDLDGNEIIAGANLTIAATHIACNTKLTANRGDFLHLVCNVAATSWRCIGKRGIWVTD